MAINQRNLEPGEVFVDTVCIAPGDYRDWGVLRLTSEQNPTVKRILRTGSMTPDHPALQTHANQVLIAGLDIAGNFKPTRNWHVQHLTVAPIQTAFAPEDAGYIRTRAAGEGLSTVTKAENVTLTGMVFDGNDAVPGSILSANSFFALLAITPRVANVTVDNSARPTGGW